MRVDLDSLTKKTREYAQETLSLQAAASVLPDHIAKFAWNLSEVTAEGYPGFRFHSGADLVDDIENLCIDSAKLAFNANYANVQALSCSMANIATYSSLLDVGDRILSLDLKHGGHLSHGAPMSMAAQLYEVHTYPLQDHVIDFDLVRDRARSVRPQLIICGASAYPRSICYKTFREIADEVGALLLADISHVSGLVAAGLVQSPIDYAHVTTTSTYKQLYGPRGGLILAGSDHDLVPLNKRKPIHQLIDRGLFPGFQGTPDFRQIAQKALALEEAQTKEFEQRMKRVLRLARILSDTFRGQGLDMITGGTDTHMVLVDLSNERVKGNEVESLLESIGILVNRNLIPNDCLSPNVTSGVRFGTNIVAYRGLDEKSIQDIAQIVVSTINEATPAMRNEHKQIVDSICRKFPLNQTCADVV
ncbi:MAG: serine hydroxymethyltransferase [Pseudomonadota bacterium]